MCFSALLSVFSWLFLFSSVSALLMNTTVDDSNPLGASLVYSPPHQWIQLGTSELGAFGLDATRVSGSTLHMGSMHNSKTTNVTIMFTGTAIYVFNALQTHVETNLRFQMDGETMPGLTIRPIADGPFAYNYCVFATAALPPGRHQLTMFSGGSAIFLDYITYSSPVNMSKRRHQTSTLSPPAVQAMVSSVDSVLRRQLLSSLESALGAPDKVSSSGISMSNTAKTDQTSKTSTTSKVLSSPDSDGLSTQGNSTAFPRVTSFTTELSVLSTKEETVASFPSSLAVPLTALQETSSAALGLTSTTSSMSTVLDSSTNLPQSTISTLSIPVPVSSSVAFTVAVMNDPTPTTSSKSQLDLGATIGIIVGSVAGLIVLLALSILLYSRQKIPRRTTTISPFPLVPPPAIHRDSPPSTASTFVASPTIGLLSFQNDERNGETRSLASTLATEIFPLPCEVEHVYQQLEALSTEVESIRRRESSIQSKEAEAYGILPATRTVQGDIESLRVEIHRMKQMHRTSIGASDFQSIASNGPLRPLELLRDLALLRAEIEELLQQTQPIERLPSYSSRRSPGLHSRFVADDHPPPLPAFPAHYYIQNSQVSSV